VVLGIVRSRWCSAPGRLRARLAGHQGRIEPFIVTLGTLGIFRAVLTWLSDGGALTLDFNLSEPTARCTTRACWACRCRSGCSPWWRWPAR
jgi:hypothetical protein